MKGATGREWWVAHFMDDPAGPSFRARCIACPWLGPIRRVRAHLVTSEVREAARHGHGPIAEAGAVAYGDLGRHLAKPHGIDNRPTIALGHRSLRFDLREAG